MQNPVNRVPYIHHGDCSAIFTMVTVAHAAPRRERERKRAEGGAREREATAAQKVWRERRVQKCLHHGAYREAYLPDYAFL